LCPRDEGLAHPMRTVFPRGKGTRSTHLVCEHKMTFAVTVGEDENPYLTLAPDRDLGAGGERTVQRGPDRSFGGQRRGSIPADRGGPRCHHSREGRR